MDQDGIEDAFDDDIDGTDSQRGGNIIWIRSIESESLINRSPSDLSLSDSTFWKTTLQETFSVWIR